MADVDLLNSRWVEAMVWCAGSTVRCISKRTQWEALPDAILGVVGVRADGSKDNASGYDWYGWYPFADGTWRVSGHYGPKAENERQAARYPGAVWKEGLLVSDPQMAVAASEMSEFLSGPRRDDCGCGE